VTVHTVESTTETVRSGFFDPTAPPVATIEPGDLVSTPPVIRTTAQILQHLVKVDGRWLISRRSVAGSNR
jgi:hypothetical protein